MFNLIIKDIKNIIYDKKTLIIILVMPIVLMSILGASLKGAFTNTDDNGDIKPIKFAVVKEYDLDHETNKFKDLFQTDLMGDIENNIDYEELNPEDIFFDKFLNQKDINKITDYIVVDRAEGEKLLEENKISALVILQKNFIYNTYINMIFPGRNIVNIEVIKNIDKQFSADIIEMIITGFNENMNNIISRKMLIIDILIEGDIENSDVEDLFKLIKEDSNNNVNIHIKEVTGEDALNSFQYYSVAIMSMFLLYAASIGGKALIKEKNEYTLQRLQASGKTISNVAFSNFVRIMAIAILQSIIMIIYSTLVISVDWGDLLTVITAMFTSSFAVAGLGAFVSVLTLITDKYYIANLFEFIIVHFMALVGGSYIPVEILPKALQKLNFIAINGSAIKIYLNGMNYRPMEENIKYILLLIGIGILFSFCALLLISSKRGRKIA